MRAQIVIDSDELQIGVRLPVERDIEITRKNAPLRPVVEFDDMAFGVGFDLHQGPVLVQALRTSSSRWIGSRLYWVAGLDKPSRIKSGGSRLIVGGRTNS